MGRVGLHVAADHGEQDHHRDARRALPTRRAPTRRAPTRRAPTRRAPTQRGPTQRGPTQRGPAPRAPGRAHDAHAWSVTRLALGAIVAAQAVMYCIGSTPLPRPAQPGRLPPDDAGLRPAGTGS